MPIVDRITVFPIKSLDGHDLGSSSVLYSGALVGDRQYALVDGWGKYVNGKNCPAIHRIRASYSDDLKSVNLRCAEEQGRFAFATDQDQIADWCSKVVGTKCRLIENRDGGFPDDGDSPGPTLVSTATLQAVSGWFDDLDLSESRRRFRFNIEVAETVPFWEDGLVPEERCVRRFSIGEVVWQGNGVCRRCVVPTRNSFNGSVDSGFAREFVRQRELQLPDWAPQSRFDTFYRLGVNMRIESDGTNAMIRVGDKVSLAEGL